MEGGDGKAGKFYEENFSLPDSPSEPIRRSRVGSGNPSATRFLKKARRRPGLSNSKGKKRPRSKKPPKIFLTRLPLNELQDPEIFFTKIIKEEDSSVKILPSDLGPDQLEALAQSPSLMFEEVRVYERENALAIEESEDVAIGGPRRSNLVYQDGLRNVNSMIFNSQAVEEKEMPAKKTEGISSKSKWGEEPVTLVPNIKSVSSTAMVMQVFCDDCEGEVSTSKQDKASLKEEVKASRQTGWWREENWVLPILILASATLLLLLLFQVLLLVKSIRGSGSSRCTRLTSQLLLTGLLACATIAFLYTLAPSHTSCALIRFGSGLSYSIVYSTLLVKLIFLICLNSGIYLTAAYQAVLLFFAILIQLAIGIQGLVADPPDLSVSQECLSTFEQELLGQLYNVFLILLVTLLSLKFRGVRQNYREALYIGFAMGLNTTVWVFWVLTGFVVPDPYRDLCSSAGILASALVTFTVMFLPKGRQMALGKNPKVEVEQFYSQEDGSGDSTVNLSTLSLFSGNEGELSCCPLVKMLRGRSQERRTAAQAAAVSSFLNRTFGKPLQDDAARACASSLDGSIYSTAEIKPPNNSDEDARGIYLGRDISPADGGSGHSSNVYQLNNNYDRFPFMSRPPQFAPGGSQAPTSTLYKMDSKTLLKSKPSMSNPNVLFCTPEDMTRTIIY